MRLFLIGLAAAFLLHTAAASAESGTPGSFDYYLLSLSWSPEYCASGSERVTATDQCAAERRFGFVLHGLWPQYSRGGYPMACNAGTTEVPETLVQKMLPVMPARGLIRHEWEKHGSCTGLSQDAYFDLATRAYQTVHIPDAYRTPPEDVRVSIDRLKSAFQAANPGLVTADLTAVCKKQYLTELRLCLSKDLQPQPCGPDIRDRCRGDVVVLRPVR